MEIFKKILKYIIIEALIVFIYVFSINNYIGNVDKTINADGIGYYDYLPSVFIHHDILRKDITVHQDSAFYSRVMAMDIYVDYNNFKLNKYPCGVAILQLPFFAYAYITSELDGSYEDGYQGPFQRAVFYAALFYLFLSLIFLRKTLELYKLKKHIIIFCQIILVFSTSITHYANYEAGYSHVYSLFAITSFIYFAKSYFRHANFKHFILCCLFLGLIFILRQLNILIILFIPFLAGSISNFKSGLIKLFRNLKWLITGTILFVGICFIQFIFWYLQTGVMVLYSYQGERFYFSDPQFFNILFSYRKGLFVYTPVLMITLFSLVWLTYKRKYFLILTWLSFFLILTYIFSSWEYWDYGCSYGLRTYIDYYAIFFIPMALMLDQISIKIRLVVMAIALLTIPLNYIQAYQYKEFILHWSEMDKEMYWKVFLKTDNRFKWMVWKKNYDLNQYSAVEEIYLGEIMIPGNTSDLVFKINCSDIPDFDKISIIQVLIDSDFQEDDNSKIRLEINKSDNDHNYYFHEQYLVQFHEKNLNEWQTGLYNFEFTPITDNQEKIISLEVKAGSQNSNLSNVRIRFLRRI